MVVSNVWLIVCGFYSVRLNWHYTVVWNSDQDISVRFQVDFMNKIAPFEGGLIVNIDIMRSRSKTMTECLRPLLMSMRFFGLYFSRRSGDADDSDERSCRYRWNWWMIHGIFAATLLWINVVRMFSMFTSDDEFGLILLNKMLSMVWVIQCAISQTSFYAASHLGSLQDVFTKTKLSDECAKYLSRFAIVYTAAAWSLITLALAIFVYGIFFTDGYMDINIAPFQSHVTISNPLVPRIFAYLLLVYILSAYVFPQSMTFLLAMLFTYQFKRVEKELERYLDSHDGLVGDSEIEAIRQQHQQVAMSVSHIDDCLMFSNASAFCCQLSNLILLLYMLIFYHSSINDAVMITGYTIWVVLVTAGLAFTAGGGIIINHYVSKFSVLMTLIIVPFTVSIEAYAM